MCLSGCSVTVPLLTFAKELSRVSCFPLDRSGCSQECVTHRHWLGQGCGVSWVTSLQRRCQSSSGWKICWDGPVGASSRVGECSPLISTLPLSIP